ncbi:hypothetical protein HYALB_00001614 [Hymenoscyphus albidus]|uniref:Protein kinase domain-containing protein n=1 Tax=Hymenoscyphus albidus TaxID=595503 RepID=A0A9N9LE52_9HELO|nr:hypothetical protein HYALB_00001614 [Hymenoscyphus albidus]
MEYCEHGDLRSYLKEHGRLPEGQAQDTAWQILQGLQFMYQNKFAHRDLKPANILIKSKTLDEWHVKICDLGLSKRIEGATASTVRGTPGFTPPEIFLGVSKDSSTVYPFAIDMWCLGETVYNILTLEPAFNDVSAGRETRGRTTT